MSESSNKGFSKDNGNNNILRDIVKDLRPGNSKPLDDKVKGFEDLNEAYERKGKIGS